MWTILVWREICELVADPRPVVEHRSGGYISLDQEFLILGNAATIDRQRAVYLLCMEGLYKITHNRTCFGTRCYYTKTNMNLTDKRFLGLGK